MEHICRAVGTTGAALVQSDIRTDDIPMTASVAEVFGAYFHNDLHLNDVRAVRGAQRAIGRARSLDSLNGS
jgi:hypothetical protein